MFQGKAAICAWVDIAADEQQDFREWHNREHLPERLALPGFNRGRRFVAIDGAPQFLFLYEVDGIEVLHSAEYAQRYDNPTPWTALNTARFRNLVRGLFTLRGSAGSGNGGFLATLQATVAAGEGDLAAAALAGIADLPGCLACHALAGEADAIVLIEASSLESLREACGRAAQALPRDVAPRIGFYALEAALERVEIRGG